MQIESQAVESARMLEQFEGSVAALREIERQYGSLQVVSPSVRQSSTVTLAHRRIDVLGMMGTMHLRSCACSMMA